MKHVLVTGAAGFIGFHLIKKLLNRGDTVVGLDSINDYYDVSLKYGRLGETGIEETAIEYNKSTTSRSCDRYRFMRLDLNDKENLGRMMAEGKFDVVCNLAAQAGVRYSLTNPQAYIDANIVGFSNILEACRHNEIKHLVYASSSSVYGLNKKIPFATSDPVDHPVSLYAASKKSNELMAHCYSHLFGLPTTGLRFFTVYGPWGRPDMALFMFTKAIREGRSIDVYNYGGMKRDFTYVDDVVEGLLRVIDNIPQEDPKWQCIDNDCSRSSAPYRIYNIGNSSPVKLMDFIEEIERALGKSVHKNLMPMQAGDVVATWADISDLAEDFCYQPRTPISVGIKNFIDWYLDFYE